MKKRIAIVLGILLLISGGAWLYSYWDNRNLYGDGEGDQFDIRIGESITIKLGENGSTGYAQCWINESKVHCVKLVEKQYIDGWRDCDGCGGTISLTFSGTKEGTDTIKFTDCPLGPMQKECSDFSDDSIPSNNSFIVHVSK